MIGQSRDLEEVLDKEVGETFGKLSLVLKKKSRIESVSCSIGRGCGMEADIL